MEKSNSLMASLRSAFAAIVMPILIVAAFLIYYKIFGSPDNFRGGDPAGQPLENNYMGIIYKGGIIVPVLISLLLMTVTFALERFFTLAKASGKGRTNRFVARIKNFLITGEIDKAVAECERQRGSVANVVKAGLLKYQEMEHSPMEEEKKILAIQKDIEETTQLEMPMLQRNLIIIATMASIATLVGLLGTVIGMIKAFAALATGGAPDAVELANGISEALINTALGIGTSALAIIFYNYFTNKIDSLTYAIDEAGFSIIQTFASRSGLKR